MGANERKISIAMITTDLPINGISTVIMNYCANMDLNRFQITVIAGEPIAKFCEERIIQSGIKVKKLVSRRKNAGRFYCGLLWELLFENYDMVHIHGNSATVTDELLVAWICRIPIRIVHSHNSTCSHISAHKKLLPLFNLLYTSGLACSDLAGRWLFRNRPFTVLPNGFETSRFHFDREKRTEERKRLGLMNKFIIGNVARFNHQKNHPFLLKIFEKVAEQDENAWLVLVGDGPEYDKVVGLIQQHTYKERIVTYGVTDETEKVYDAMDVFVFPSKFEGLGIVLLEAQISGLPCITSDVVPTEVQIGENIAFLPLDNGPDFWAKQIIQTKTRNAQREVFYKEHKTAIDRFNIKQNAEFLGKYYGEL